MATVADLLAAAAHLQPAQLRELRDALDRLHKDRNALRLDLDTLQGRLVRLDDADFFRLHRRSIAIEEDNSFQLYLLYMYREGRLPSLPQSYLALVDLFGDSGHSFDNYKGSFSFPLALDVDKGGRTFAYLLEIGDYRGSLEFRLRKIVAEDDERLPQHRYHAPLPEELSREQINRLIVYLHGFLQGYWQSIRNRAHRPFRHAIPSNGILYGYCNGRCFEKAFKSTQRYEAACRRYDKLIEHAKQAGEGEAPADVVIEHREPPKSGTN
jgi:hypothetical protein